MQAVAVAGVALLVLAFGAVQAEGASMIKEDFERDPAKAGWTYSPANAANPGRWSTGGSHSGTHHIMAKEGQWESPKFAVTPQQYYRVTFYSKGDPAPYGHYYCMFFHDAQGKELVADHYGSFDPSITWLKNEFCVRAKAGAVAGQLRFQPRDNGGFQVDDVTVEAVTVTAALDWADELYQSLPPLTYTPPKDRFRPIPRTMGKLRAGGSLRIVMLGDSIINDTGNSPLDLVIGRHYPEARIEVITSVGGGKGTGYFRQENRVKSYIVDLKPDLLIIGGISGTKPDDNEDCIRQMRDAGCNPEIMLMTGPITPRFERDGQPWPTAIDPDGGRSGRSALLQEATERNYAFFDIQSPFSQYEFSAGKTPEFFRRDSIHANDRARTILAKIVECWFSPDSAARAE